MLSKQIKQAYTQTIVFISIVTLFLLSLYILSAIYLRLDIIFLLLVFILILTFFTGYMSLTFIKLSSRFINQTVIVNKRELKNIDEDTFQRISFAKGSNRFDHMRFVKDEIFKITAYNFKYVRMIDQHDISYLLSTEDVEVVRD